MRELLPILIVLSFAAGCASTRPETKANRPLPEPATFRISGTLTANLTPQLMAQTGLPQTIKGSLEAHARSEAISSEPLRSRHDGHMKLTLTDGEGKQSLANIDILPRAVKVEQGIIERPAVAEARSRANVQLLLPPVVNVSGDSDGSPTKGLGQAITRFLDAASMMTRPIPQAGGPAR